MLGKSLIKKKLKNYHTQRFFLQPLFKLGRVGPVDKRPFCLHRLADWQCPSVARRWEISKKLTNYFLSSFRVFSWLIFLNCIYAQNLQYIKKKNNNYKLKQKILQESPTALYCTALHCTAHHCTSLNWGLAGIGRGLRW